MSKRISASFGKIKPLNGLMVAIGMGHFRVIDHERVDYNPIQATRLKYPWHTYEFYF
jgi:hypothetical protein